MTPDNIRPWGHYEVLETLPTHRVKRVVVNPGHRLSLQFHKHRSEHWIIVTGRGLVTLGEEEREVGPGAYIIVPCATNHRVKCLSDEPLCFVEVWTGDYLGEDDIIRLQDDYARPETHPRDDAPPTTP